ncbi:glycine cleavage system protein GcvH [Cutibacterium equinum]|uniref:Glycine cleavage system H protein n=1 Tax=Cutibacterium equinum TaxID=3016342 RepID=A0ABY7QZZ5_9ACTN|nr:glycine cleavage system protein GcvH [Cutibacterium equinum]WCC80566.1 glycine cleavage system protein GcvH [Cutibacterium equinum]
MELSDLKYSPDHEWVAVDGDIMTVGITDYAADALGDVVFVDIPETGSDVQSGSAVGEVESTKSVSDLFSPVTGTVCEVNEAVSESPELVNSDPFGQGWLFKVSGGQLAEDLMDRDAYLEITTK